jgi:hypothetical protein
MPSADGPEGALRQSAPPGLCCGFRREAAHSKGGRACACTVRCELEEPLSGSTATARYTPRTLKCSRSTRPALLDTCNTWLADGRAAVLPACTAVEQLLS